MQRLFVLFSLFFGLIASSLFGQIPSSPKASRTEGSRVNGLKEGIWLVYYPDGKIMAREEYLHDQLSGLSIGYFPDGQISYKEQWKEDLQQDSAWYFHPNGKLHRKGRYEGGSYEGIWKTWDENGTLVQQLNYHLGLPDGLFKSWFPSGQMEQEGFYRAGKKDGAYLFYFDRPGKVLFQSAAYSNDKEVGLWVEFNRKGKVVSTRIYPMD